MTTTTTAKAPAKASKAVRQETTKALTAAQQAALGKLVQAAQKSIGDAVTAEQGISDLLNQAGTAKVYAGRALAKLSTHPAVVATGGPTKGQPALTKMATLIGRPATTLDTYWKGAKALISKGWDKRTGAPSKDEIALMNAPFLKESARVTASVNSKGKGKGKPASKGTRSTTVSFSTIDGQLDALVESVTKYVGSMGFSAEQASALAAKLDAVHDAIESATAKTDSK